MTRKKWAICPIPGCGANLTMLTNVGSTMVTGFNSCPCGEQYLRGHYDRKGQLSRIEFQKRHIAKCPHPDCDGTIPFSAKLEGITRCICHACQVKVKWIQQDNGEYRPYLALVRGDN